MRSSNDLAVIADKPYSYNDCNRLTAGLIKHLSSQGIKPGDVIAFTPSPSIESILTFFALFRLGCIAFPLSHRLPEAQIDALLIKANARLITPTLAPEANPTPAKLQSIATYTLTSGSTSEPKIAIHTLANHIYSALGVNSYFSLSPSNRWELSLPLFHISGLAILFRCFLAGAAVTINQPFTHISWVPTQLMRALENPPTCKAILIGGAPLSTSLALQASHLPIHPSYGLTEMSSTVTIKNQLLPYRRLKHIDHEIHLSGPTLFHGYLGEPPQAKWFATGDIENNGISRKDRLFISGGENIQPEEIERALYLVGIKRACVVPVPDPEFGMRPVAFVDKVCILDDLRCRLEPHLPRFKHPVALFPLPEASKFNYANLTEQAAALMHP